MSDTIQIKKSKYMDVTKRTWRNLDDVLKTFSKEEVVAIVHRWCDGQTYRNDYMSNRKAKQKAAWAYYQAHKAEIDGTRVDMSGEAEG